MALRQTTSVGEYTAQFQKYASKTKWDEDALMAQYYRGLKDEVKDNYVRINPAPETLHEMIEAATKIRSKDTITNSQTSLQTSTYGAGLYTTTQDPVEAREGAKVQRQTMLILW